MGALKVVNKKFAFIVVLVPRNRMELFVVSSVLSVPFAGVNAWNAKSLTLTNFTITTCSTNKLHA